MGRASIQRPIVWYVTTKRDISFIATNANTLAYQGQVCQTQKKLNTNAISRIALSKLSDRPFRPGPNGRVSPRTVSALVSKMPENVASSATADKISH